MKTSAFRVGVLAMALLEVSNAGAAAPTQEELALARRWAAAHLQPVRALPDAVPQAAEQEHVLAEGGVDRELPFVLGVSHRRRPMPVDGRDTALPVHAVEHHRQVGQQDLVDLAVLVREEGHEEEKEIRGSGVRPRCRRYACEEEA